MFFTYKEEKEDALLDELMSSKRVVSTSRGPVWLYFPTSDDRLFAKFVYKQSYERLVREGTPTLEETFAEHEENGLWGKSEEQALEKLPEFIKETVDNIGREKNRARRKKYEHWLKQLERKLAELYIAKNTLFANSAELLASRQAEAYIAFRTFRNRDGNTLWPNFDSMMNNWSDKDYVSELIGILEETASPSEQSVIRKIARGGHWRLCWNVAKESPSELFGRSMADLNTDQLMLVYWSQVYDSAFEALERPPSEVINNDELFDKWLEDEHKKREREVGQKYYGKGHSKNTRNSKIDNSPEVFKIVQGYYNDEGQFIFYTDEERWAQIEKMRSLNSPDTRAAQRQTEQRLKSTPGQFYLEEQIKDKVTIEATGGTVTEKRKR